MGKIFVRERRHARHGLAIVAVHGANLKVFKARVCRTELEAIAAEIGAQVVYLPQGEQEEESRSKVSRRRHRRRKQDKD